jgi:hypothetical protein
MPAGADLAEAEARLGAALERELGVPLDLGAEPAAPASSAPPGPRGAGGLWRALLAPRFRPALAFAAVVAIAGGAWMIAASRREAGEPLMRGPAAVAPGSDLAAGEAPEPLEDGSLRLSWTPAAEAASYTVLFLSPDLTEIARVEGLAESRLDLRPGSLPAGLTPGTQVLWRVLAMRGADEVARSRTLPVTLPDIAP